MAAATYYSSSARRHPSIHSLPSELLIQIFSHVGASHYRADLRRLHVCQRWYPLARMVLFSHLTLHTTTLLDERFPGPALDFLKRTTQAVTIRLTDVFNTREDASIAARRLHAALTTLSKALRGFRGLRKVELKVGYRIDERDLFQPRVDYLRAATVRALVDGVLGAGATLTTLVLDTSGSEFVRGTTPGNGNGDGYGDGDSNGNVNGNGNGYGNVDGDGGGGGGGDGDGDGVRHVHVCELLARRIPSLRRCWLTMRRICPEIFRFGEHVEGGSGLVPPGGCRLESLVVCLSLDSSWFRSHVEYSHRCNPAVDAWEMVRRVPGWTLLEELVAAFRGVRESLPRLRVGRVVCNRFPGMERVAVDLITGKRVRLREGAEMEDEGETEEEGEMEDDGGKWGRWEKEFDTTGPSVGDGL